MGLRAGAAALAVLLTAFAGVKGPAPSNFELWRARRLAHEYEVRTWGGPGAARAAKRIAELLELAEGKPARVVDGAAAPLRRAGPGVCTVVVGVASGEPWTSLTREVKVLDERWKSLAAAHPAFTGISFFDSRDGAPLLGIVAADEAKLLAAVADASLPGAGTCVPDLPRVQALDESRFVEWSPLLPPRVDYAFGFVEYCVSQRDTPLDAVKELHGRVEESLKRFEAAAGALPRAPERVQVVLYPSLTEKLVNTGTPSLTSVRFTRGTVEAVHGGGVLAFDPADVLRVVQHRAFGLLPSLALESGLPAWCAAPGELESARALALAGLAGSAADLTNAARRGRRSPLVLTALDRAYAAAAVKVWPKGGWLAGDATPAESEALGRAYGELVKTESAPASRPARGAWLDGSWCGFELRTAAGTRWYDAALGDSLARARSVGATHVVLTTLRRPGERQVTFAGIGGPTDGEVAHVAAVARAKGLRILLQTNVAGVRRGGWFGESFKLKSRDWEPYFDELGEAWAHDALLARQYCDGWILGSGFRGTTGAAETVEMWRGWIGRLRKLDAGPLGYVGSWQPAARWLEGTASFGTEAEFQKVGFWGDLDFIGVDMSMPVADGDGALPSTGALVALLDAAEATAAAAKKPLALFDVGYPATSRGYETPWRRNGEPALAPQEASYRAAVQAVQSRAAVRGIVVAAWPAGAAVNPLGSDWFSPVGRPAETSVRALFDAVRSH